MALLPFSRALDGSTFIALILIILCPLLALAAKYPKSHNNNHPSNRFESLIHLNPNYVPNRWRPATPNYDFLLDHHHRNRHYSNSSYGDGDSYASSKKFEDEIYFSYVKSNDGDYMSRRRRRQLEQQQQNAPSSKISTSSGVGSYYPNYDNNQLYTSSSSNNNIGLFSMARDLAALFPSVAMTTTACLGVFLSWQVPSQRCRRILQNWFVASVANLRHGRWPSLILSSLSHAGFFHIWFNLMALLSFGPAVQRSLQSNSLQKWPLWPLLLGSALAGSFTFLAWNHWALRSPPVSGCMGLSAVTFCLVTVHARMNPRAHMRLLIMGIVPVAMTARILLTTMLITTLVMMAVSLSPKIHFRAPNSIAHAAHLGGIVFGLLYYEVWQRRYRIGWKLHQFKRHFT